MAVILCQSKNCKYYSFKNGCKCDNIFITLIDGMCNCYIPIIMDNIDEVTIEGYYAEM